MNIFSSRFLLLGIFAILVFASCEKKVYQTIVELDEENIQSYIRQNNLTMLPFGKTGMYYQVLEEGNGKELNYSEIVPLVYTLKTHDGSFSSLDTFSVINRYADYLGYFPYGSEVADSQPGAPLDKEEGLKLILNQILKKANGKVRVLVPSRYAYGRNGSGKIGSNQSIDYVIHAIDTEDLPEYEDYSIKKYLSTLGTNANDYIETPSGIYYHISQEGTGKQVQSESTIEIGYILKTLNGIIAEQSSTDSLSISLASTIAGWREILPKMKEGGKVRMILPSSQAYGIPGTASSSTNGSGIPPFSAIDFEVSVKKVVR
jgi:FKBP-type peptidyl-prolyl cis-trans isomerase